jgi:hypothetical protein
MARQPPLRLPLVEYTGATLAPLDAGQERDVWYAGTERFQERIRSQDPYCRADNCILS